MIKLVLVRPESVISHCVVSFYKKLKVWVVYLALNHPLLDHLQNRTRNLLDNPADELLSLWTTGKHESVDGRANRTTS